MFLTGVEQRRVGVGDIVALHPRFEHEIGEDTPRKLADSRVIRRHTGVHHFVGLDVEFAEMLRHADADSRRLHIAAREKAISMIANFAKPCMAMSP